MYKIRKVLKEQYDLDSTNVSSQQGGWSALAYKVQSSKGAYFLKVYEKSRASTPKWTALIDKYVPILVWLKQNSGLKGKIPVPVATKNGAYECEDEDGIYLLYEYVEGETIGDNGLTEEQVRSLSAIIAELHSYGEEIPVETSAIKEDFIIPFLPPMRNFLEKENDKIDDDVRALINPHIEQIKKLIDTLKLLSESLKNSHVRMALCHTDLHNWNLMQSDRELILIDWEGLRLAPVEADLMFLVDQPYYDDFLNMYRKVHQHFAINPDILEFYQYRRKLEDIWEFMEQLLFDHQDEQERTNTMNSLVKELKEISG